MYFARVLAIFAAVILLCGELLRAEDDAPELRVCLVSGSEEYNSHESLAAFQKFAEVKYPIKCTRVFAESESGRTLQGIEKLDDCDVALLFTRRLQVEGEDLQRIKEYCLAGRPIVGVRTASHAFQNWLELDREVLGGNYQGHYGEGPVATLNCSEDTGDHAILAGVDLLTSKGSLYKNPNVAKDVKVLLTGTLKSGEHEPVAWTREYKGARIFYTSLGHPADFAEADFRKMLVNALFWTAARQMPNDKP